MEVLYFVVIIEKHMKLAKEFRTLSVILGLKNHIW